MKVLQREQKDDVPGGLKLIAYLTVGSIAAGLIALIAWALLRLEGVAPRQRRRARGRTSARRRIGVDTHELNEFATFPKHLVASPARRIRGYAERGEPR